MLFAALEDPADSRPRDPAGKSSEVRIVTFNRSTGAHRRTTRYELETTEGNELADVQALGTTQSAKSETDVVLTLETATSATGYTVQLYEAYLNSRRDVSHCDSVASNCSTPADAVEKIAVLDFAALGRCSFPGPDGATEQLCTGSYRVGTWSPLQVDNFKAMAIGPKISDGRRTLLLVNDDSSAQQRGTHFVLLALNEEHPTELHALSAVHDGPLVVLVACLLILMSIVSIRVFVDKKLRQAEEQSWTTASSKPVASRKMGYKVAEPMVKFTNPEAFDSQDAEASE